MRSNIKNLLITLLTSLIFYACQDFDELNSNPTKASDIDPNSQLSYAQVFSWGDWEIVQTYHYYCATFVQLLQGEWSATQYGGMYRINNEYMNSLWAHIYNYPIKNLVDILNRTKDNEKYNDLYHIARITEIYYLMILSDMYGDIPYDDAGKGYIDNIVSPVYNTQKYIYHDILSKLKESVNKLGTIEASNIVTGDIIYDGDVEKWKRLANSLRLRAAMRLVKVEPETALSEVKDIISDGIGVMCEGEDAVISYENYVDWNNEYRRNAQAQLYRGRETFPCPYICSTLWEMLKYKEDPRMFRIARCYSEVGYSSIPMGRVDLTEEMLSLKGLDIFQPVKPGYFWYDNWPSGYQSTLTKTYEMKACRPVMNNAFLNTDTPGIIMTYAETQLLLSEAVVRWGMELGDNVQAEDYYNKGVKASMKLLSKFKVDEIKNEEIEDYLNNKGAFPDSYENRIKYINEELWILHLHNAPEAYSNWRRTGYPELKPAGDYGINTIDSETIPRRLIYPVNESAYNNESYKAAIDALGGSNSWNARVWWDVE